MPLGYRRPRSMRRYPIALAVFAVVLAAVPVGRAAVPPPLPSRALLLADRANFADLSAGGLNQIDNLWWKPSLGFYSAQTDGGGPEATPYLWWVFPLFEAKAAAALARPTAANKAAVNAFALAAQKYWDPTAANGVGAYSSSYNVRYSGNPYFDDNGWFGIAYMDAYAATKNARWLKDATRALTFIDKYGWDAKGGGGIWWDVSHELKTSEPLAAGAVIAARLYAATKKPTYLAIAKKYIAWADAHTQNPKQGNLYGRNATDGTIMDYVEGMMISAHVSLCNTTKQQRWCKRAQDIAAASLNEFPIVAPWAPETDVIYLRGFLDLYAKDRDPRWYSVVYANAVSARAKARDAESLWSLGWDGKWASPPGTLYTTAATVQLFAWLAATTPPAVA
jgi:Glycosyl hydrolase family 76